MQFCEFVPTIPSTTVGSFYFSTKDIDLGAPGVRKKIYKVYVTYRCTGDSNIQVEYGTNQGLINNSFSATDSTNYGSSTLDTSSGVYQVAELKPSSSINNIYSFQLGFTSLAPPPSDFEINDITVIYRAKRVK